MTVGKRIRTLRSACGMTQAGLAEKLHVSRSYQCRIENDSSTISLAYIQSVADVLQVTPQEILCDILDCPEGSSTAEQVKILIEKLPPETQLFTLDTLQRIITHLSREDHDSSRLS